MNKIFVEALKTVYRYSALLESRSRELSYNEVARGLRTNESLRDLPAGQFQDLAVAVFERCQKETTRLTESVMSAIDHDIGECFENGCSEEEAVSYLFTHYDLPFSLAVDLVEQWLQDNPQSEREPAFESKIDEAKRLNTKVRIVKGPPEMIGKIGHIGEIRHGIHKTAPKTYTVDYEDDYGRTASVQLPGDHLRIVRDEPSESFSGGIAEATSEYDKVTRQIDNMGKKISSLSDRLGLARERRAMAAQKGKGSGRIASEAEGKIRSKMDAARQELSALLRRQSELKQPVEEENVAEIGYADAPGDLSKSHSEIIAKATEDGQINQQAVMSYTEGNSTMYFFAEGNDISALVLLVGNNLKAIKNFTNEKGYVLALLNYIVNMRNTSLVITPDEPLTAEGFWWVAKLITSPTGLKISDLDGNPISVDDLKAEWQHSKSGGGGEEAGATGIKIGESSEAWKKKLRENESSLMPYRYFGLTEAVIKATRTVKENTKKAADFARLMNESKQRNQ